MTFEDYIVGANIYHAGCKGSQRLGQAYFNALHNVRPNLANSMRAGDTDPFHLDYKLPAFLRVVAARWNMPEYKE